MILGFFLVINSPEVGEYSNPYSYKYGDDFDWGYLFTSIIPFYFSFSFLPLAIISALLWYAYGKCELTVTDKRVYGKAMFGKRVDIPFDSISAVGTSSLFKGVSVASSSGRIVFTAVANNDEIHKVISELLINRQSKPIEQATTIKTEIAQSNADELKKYKELLDSGIITQSEFDEKKKQLLGL